MKKVDTLNVKKLKPKTETVTFLMNFSKSMEVLKSGNKKFLVSKN